MTPRALRLIRGWTGAVAATSVAAVSHFMAGGSSPEPLLLLLALALSGLACTALTGRGLSLWRLSAGVALSQGLFHMLFSGSADPPRPGAPAGGHPGHSSTLDLAGGTVLPSAADHSSPLMWVWHSVAALLTVAVLRHGEAAVVQLVQAARLRVSAYLPLFPPLPVPPARAGLPANRPVRPLPNLGAPLLVMRHRGPPLLPIVS
ncbi:hypothetical protein J2X12_003942 [Pseudarthrobacter oxydans]|uniref:Integral membrane protein n=1 Tax=Pseudarthrobacter oxydans TaxID=1671 RepID=A0AAW8NIX4_PSEOX|nr:MULTISPECIES: hypothetical protein [Micrococcaceae]MDR7165888.1 hypothetical protein [Pseudarthrobacter oxydans]TNB67652.1 hypothetical protein FHJ30_20305 [Arthrobacter sp. BB-1]VII98586.1 hypothetical protein [Arthrobacter sp. DR-2P]